MADLLLTIFARLGRRRRLRSHPYLAAVTVAHQQQAPGMEVRHRVEQLLQEWQPSLQIIPINGIPACSPMPQGIVAEVDKLAALLPKIRRPRLGRLGLRHRMKKPRHLRAQVFPGADQPIAKVPYDRAHPVSERRLNHPLQKRLAVPWTTSPAGKIFRQQQDAQVLDRRLETILQCEQPLQWVAARAYRGGRAPRGQRHGVR